MYYEKLSEQIIKYRRDLHKIPELGFNVYKTNVYVRNVLSSLSCTVGEIVKTGLTAFFDFGQEETIVFRADMDGLPIEEVTGAEYSSQHKGCMHACGHDGHTAILLGFAKVLNDFIQSETPADYNVLLVFQPAEEIIEGAKSICDSELFDNYNIKGIFGLHLWPMLPKNLIASRPGPMMAKSTEVSITFEGVSAHCGDPDKGKDALEAACRFVSRIYDFKEHNVKEPSILKFGFMESGTVRNALSSFTSLIGTMRTFEEETWDYIVSAMEDTGKDIEEKTGVKFKLDVNKSHPAVVNDKKLYDEIKGCLTDLNYEELQTPVMIAEDFSFYEKELPGVFFFLGNGSGIPLHSANYDFDDSVLITGVKLFEAIFEKL